MLMASYCRFIRRHCVFSVDTGLVSCASLILWLISISVLGYVAVCRLTTAESVLLWSHWSLTHGDRCSFCWSRRMLYRYWCGDCFGSSTLKPMLLWQGKRLFVALRLFVTNGACEWCTMTIGRRTRSSCLFFRFDESLVVMTVWLSVLMLSYASSHSSLGARVHIGVFVELEWIFYRCWCWGWSFDVHIVKSMLRWRGLNVNFGAGTVWVNYDCTYVYETVLLETVCLWFPILRIVAPVVLLVTHVPRLCLCSSVTNRHWVPVHIGNFVAVVRIYQYGLCSTSSWIILLIGRSLWLEFEATRFVVLESITVNYLNWSKIRIELPDSHWTAARCVLVFHNWAFCVSAVTWWTIWLVLVQLLPKTLQMLLLLVAVVRSIKTNMQHVFSSS